MKRPLALALAVLITTSVVAQNDSPSPKPKTGRRSSSTPVSKTLEDMKDAISAQQQQIQQLQQQIQSRDKAIQQLQQQVANLPAPQPPPPAAPGCCDEVGTLTHQVADLTTVSGNTVNELQEAQKRIAGLESPLAIHYKGITITPGGFLAAETVWRQRAEGADINTNLNGIPYTGSSTARLSEFYGSGRQSRISMLAEGKLSNMKLTGYVEADFLGTGTTSNNNQSNSYVMRQRQAWGQAALHNGWTFTGGQMWSLVTETRKGLDNRSEALPMTIDPQYTVGFSWDRGYGFRITKNIGNKAWFGFSVENSQETVTTHGNTANSFLIGSQGNSGGLYNAAINGCSSTLNSTGTAVTTTCTNLANYSFNPSPDFVGKLAFEPGFGHYEVFGVASEFRDRIFPNAGASTPSAAGAYNNSTWAGGGGGNARWSMFQKHFDLGIHALAGRGVGRYGTSGLADSTIRPNGTVAPITSYQGLLTLEYHNPKWDWYGNGGIEYDDRTAFLNAKGAPVGYGSPLFNNTGCGIETLPSSGLTAGFNPGGLSNCNADTKDILEGSFGFWYKPYNGPKGRLQFGLQYSYLTRVAWTGYGTKTPVPPGANPTAIDNMVFTSFRYYLP